MKLIIAKRNYVLWVSKKGNRAYPTMATLTNGLHNETFINSLKFYVPFPLMATRCNKVDHWFEKQRIKGPILSFTYKHNYQKIHTFKNINANNE
jgi:hypothetical protein